MAQDSLINKAQLLAEDMLVNTDEFLLFTGEANATAARTRVYHNGLPAAANKSSHTAAELAALRPFALIYTRPESGFRLRRVATETWSPSGSIVIELEKAVPSGDLDDLPQAFEDFQEQLGHILGSSPTKPAISGLTELAWTPGYLAVDQLAVDGPYINDESEQFEGRFLYAWIALDWGQSD